jgi:hypothetical protein
MTPWATSTLVALVLALGGAFYIRLRWRRSPQAYRAMIALATCYFVAGAITGAWILDLIVARPTVPPVAPSSAAAISSPATATIKENYTGPSFSIPPLHYDPAHAALPDPKLTPGDTFPGVTADDVCSPGWSREHRNVTESMRD